MRRPALEAPDPKGKGFAPGTPAHFLYNVALGGGLIAASPAWIPWVALSAKRRRNFPDRLGLRLGELPPPSGDRRVWIHAVSVGETLAAAPLVRELANRLPAAELLFSTVTLTGHEVARKSLAGLVKTTFFFPFDLPGVSGRFLDRVAPDAVAILETEIWPNFLAECAGRGIPVLILNGRISERSYRGYGRIRPLFARVIGCVAALAMQTQEDARRVIDLGAEPEKVRVTGNMKFDVDSPREAGSPFLSWLRKEKGKGTSWFVAGSTHEGEEEAVLAAFAGAREANPSVRLLLAPRHPERFDEAAQLCGRRGWEILRKSRIAGEEAESRAPIVLLDTVGDLAHAYGAADIAFVGGSLAAKGGHNILEPALYGVPIVTGSHMDNFREIAETFRAGNAAASVADPEGLSRVLSDWAADPSPFAAMGERARGLLSGLRGATRRNADLIAEALSRRAGETP